MLLNNNTQVAAGKTLTAGDNIVLADGKTLKGAGALTLQADDDITLGGATEAGGTLKLTADKDLDTVGTMWAKDT